MLHRIGTIALCVLGVVLLYGNLAAATDLYRTGSKTKEDLPDPPLTTPRSSLLVAGMLEAAAHGTGEEGEEEAAGGGGGGGRGRRRSGGAAGGGGGAGGEGGGGERRVEEEPRPGVITPLRPQGGPSLPQNDSHTANLPQPPLTPNTDLKQTYNYKPDDSKVGCKELRSQRFISDGFCRSLKPIKETVCTGHCLPEKHIPWYAEFIKVWSREKVLEYRCVDNRVKRQKVKLFCDNGDTRTYRIKVVKSCECKRYVRYENESYSPGFVNQNRKRGGNGGNESGFRPNERRHRRHRHGKNRRRRDRERDREL